MDQSAFLDLELLTSEISSEREKAKVKEEKENKDLLKFQDEYDDLVQQWFRCEYNTITNQFLDLMSEKDRLQIEQKYPASLFWLTRLGIRICDTIKRSFILDPAPKKDQFGQEPTIAEIISLSIQKDLAVFEPRQDFLLELEEFYSKVVESQGFRLEVQFNEKKNKIETSLTRYFNSKKGSVFQGKIDLPADFKQAEFEFLTTVLPAYQKIMSTVGLIQDLIQEYLALSKFSVAIQT